MSQTDFLQTNRLKSSVKDQNRDETLLLSSATLTENTLKCIVMPSVKTTSKALFRIIGVQFDHLVEFWKVVHYLNLCLSIAFT